MDYSSFSCTWASAQCSSNYGQESEVGEHFETGVAEVQKMGVNFKDIVHLEKI